MKHVNLFEKFKSESFLNESKVALEHFMAIETREKVEDYLKGLITRDLRGLASYYFTKYKIMKRSDKQLIDDLLAEWENEWGK
jgi:hypothetical protein